MSNSLNRSELADLILQYASAGSDGTLLIRSSNGHSLMIAFKKGALLSLSYGNHRGLDAIPDVLQFTSGSYSFSEGLVGRQQFDLPSANEFVEMLRGIESGTAIVPKADMAGSFANQERLVEQVAAMMVDYVGPISAVLCEYALDEIGGINSSEDAFSFVTHLSHEIDDQSDKEEFSSKAKAIVNRLK